MIPIWQMRKLSWSSERLFSRLWQEPRVFSTGLPSSSRWASAIAFFSLQTYVCSPEGTALPHNRSWRKQNGFQEYMLVAIWTGSCSTLTVSCKRSCLGQDMYDSSFSYPHQPSAQCWPRGSAQLKKTLVSWTQLPRERSHRNQSTCFWNSWLYSLLCDNRQVHLTSLNLSFLISIKMGMKSASCGGCENKWENYCGSVL